MTIAISNLTISNNAPAGTTIGVLTELDASGNAVPCTFALNFNTTNYFAISDNKLITAWSTPPNPGYYFVWVQAIGTSKVVSDFGTFSVNVVMSAPPPPPPPPPPSSPPPPPAPSITVNGSNGTVVAEGASLAIAVSNGPGNTTDWVALAATGSADTSYISWDYLNGSRTPPNTGVASATVMMAAPTTDGSYEARFYANNGFSVLARTTFTVQSVASPPPPPAPAQAVITVTPNMPEVPDTTALGAVIASYTVTMSDGSPFTGTVRFGAPYYDGGGVFALSGNNIIVNPKGPGIGPNATSLTDHITLEAIP
jgi:hypothetical protein